MLHNAFEQTKIQLLIIGVLTILAYSNIFQNSFVIDDENFIVNWKEKQEIKNIPLMLRGKNPPKFGGVYRPVRGIMYTFYDQIFGNNPFGYHLHSILVHLGVTILVYFVTRELVRQMDNGQWAIDNAKKRKKLIFNYFPFIASLLFGLHPVHTESITFMTSAMDMTGVLFMFAALYLYVIEKKIYSYIFAGLAFFSYEPALVLMPLLIAYDVIIKKIPLREIFNNAKKYLPYFIIASSYIFIRLVLIGRNPTYYKYLADSFYHTQLMMTKVFVKYLSLLVAPFNLSINHIIDPGFETFNPPVNDLNNFLSQSIFDFWVLVSILIILLLLFAAFFFLKKTPLISFGLLWIFISYLPFANLTPQPTALAERYLYIPSFGFCLILGYLMVSILNIEKKKSKIFLVCILTLLSFLFILYFYLTYHRNLDWKDTRSIWSKVLAVSPESGFAAFILAGVYQEEGNFKKAEELFKKTLEFKPGYVSASLELGRLYHQSGKQNEALKVLIEAVQPQINPIDRNRLDASVGELAKIYTEVGLIQSENGKYMDAFTDFEQALSLYPGYVPAKSGIESLIKNHPELEKFANSYLQENWVGYISTEGLSFQYPKDWNVSEEGGKVAISVKDRKALIVLTKEEYNGDREEYLARQTDEHGILINQRYTVLGVDKVYAKIWNNKNTPETAFYIFQPKWVIKLFVSPSEVSMKNILEGVIKTLKTEE